MADITDTMKAQLCVSCSDPRGKTPAKASQCFDLTKQTDGNYEALLERVGHGSDSTFLLVNFPESGTVKASLYGIAGDEKAVTSSDIAKLCGGRAPYFWSSKRLRREPTSTLPHHDMGLLTTDDGAIYSWEPKTASFEALSARPELLRGMATYAKLKGQLQMTVVRWLITGGLKSIGQAVFDQAVNLPTTLLDLVRKQHESRNEAEQCRDLRRAYGPTASAWQRSIEKLGAQLASSYVTHRDHKITVHACPMADEAGLAIYDPETRSITMYLNHLQSTERLMSSARDQIRLDGALLAHEFGHYRHHVEAGAGEGYTHYLTSQFGLPASIASPLDNIFVEWHMPLWLQNDFVTHYRTQFKIPNGYDSLHAPGHGEIVARLYELNQLSLQPSRAPLVGKYANDVLQQMETLAQSLVQHYKAFPNAAEELQTLFMLILLDGAILPKTRQFGIRLVAEMALRLPPESYAVPLNCKSPLEVAGLPPQVLKQLPDTWCSLTHYVEQYRATKAQLESSHTRTNNPKRD